MKHVTYLVLDKLGTAVLKTAILELKVKLRQTLDGNFSPKSSSKNSLSKQES